MTSLAWGCKLTTLIFIFCTNSRDRSSEDEYTPPHQVEYIQDLVLSQLSQFYSGDKNTKLSVSYNYLDKYSDYFYETPGDVCDCSYL